MTYNTNAMNVIMKDYPKRTWDLEMIYKCDERDYEGKSKINVKAHVKQKHIGIRYSCGECDYQGSSRGNLRAHVKIIQFRIKYKCDICDYQGGTKNNLKMHVELKHLVITYKLRNVIFKEVTYLT